MKVRRLVAVSTLLPILLAAGVVDGGETGEPPPFRGYRWIEKPQLAPDYVFTEGDEREWGFLEFRGKVVIATFWATWCGVCAREMPKLDRLQASFGGEGLTVVALSQDRGGAEVVERYFAERGIRHLRVFRDAGSVLGAILGIRGVPTSFLIDKGGRMVGVTQGPADWESREAKAILEHYLKAGDVEKVTETKNGDAVPSAAAPDLLPDF